MATRIYKTPFAATGDKEVLATADQPDGKVSLQAGWTPDYELANDSPNYRPVGRAEMNGILNEITGALGELQMSGFAPWQAVSGGWPKDAYVVHEGVAYRSLIDSNEDTPGTSEASWVPAFNYGIGVVSGLTNANVTLNAGQYSKPIITLSGALTGNVQIIFPKTLQRWLVVNNTTGAFTVTCKTAAGTGVAVPQGSSMLVWGDGTNLYPVTGNQATQAQVDAGTDDTTIVSPKKLKNGFAISLAANGYVKFPSWLGGWIVQWAAAAADITVPAQASDAQTITFPMAFPNAVFRVFPTVMATSGSRMFGAPFTPTLTNVVISLNNSGTSSGTGRSSLFAIGN